MISDSIDHFSCQISSLIDNFNFFIITGETGSGKTTRLPLFLFFTILCKKKMNMVCCQPRRLAVKLVSTRVAKNMKTIIGKEIGFAIRFEKFCSNKTKIKFVTEGLLMKELIKDNLLKQYSIVILDEVHERSRNMDFLLTHLKKLATRRSDIKVIICSATLEIRRFSKYFHNCPVFSIPGRIFSIKVFFSKNVKKNFISACFFSIFKVLKNLKNGNLLIFLPGKNEIDLLGHLLHSSSYGFEMKKADIIPVHGGLSLKIQVKMIKSLDNILKIYLSTNISETSLTLPNISVVIDSGLCKKKIFNPWTKSENLVSSTISRLCAVQRKGRTGRTRMGVCYRIYTKWSYRFEMKKRKIPEIQRTDLSGIILLLQFLKNKNLIQFDWIDPPAKLTILQNLKTLYLLCMLNKNGEISGLGKKAILFPMTPFSARSLIVSKIYNSLNEVLIIISLLLVQFERILLFKQKHNLLSSPGNLEDHMVLVKIYQTWSRNNFSAIWCEKMGIDYSVLKFAKNIKIQVKGILKRLFCPIFNDNEIRQINRAIFTGFFLNICVLDSYLEYIKIFSKKKLIINLSNTPAFKNKKLTPVLLYYVENELKSRQSFNLVLPLKKNNIKKYFGFYK
jgi:HrpA-like RNA helicase